jgi:uncharacterized membrane protein
MPIRHEVSRIEGFSDAVFGFALTLLVVSLEVPSDYRSLTATLGGFLPFAATFTSVVWIWYEHYLLFRKFGLEDGITVVLNAALLFVVLFYVYPLKFVLSNLVPQITASGLDVVQAGFAGMTLVEARRLMVVYSGGFMAVFGLLALMYLHAWRIRDRLGLDRLGAFDARAGFRRHLVSVSIGLLSVVLAVVVPGRLLWTSGVCLSLLGPAHAWYGYRNGMARERLQRELSAPVPDVTVPPADEGPTAEASSTEARSPEAPSAPPA